MSGEIEVSETPNWLQELEAKREKRLKARLGHEAGAGAPCLKCGEKCPGLDLHFWRKCCKICKCSKEEHEVQDDDIYGWAQFQLLGSKPNKIKRKIVLPGKKDELELDWTPKGHTDTVEKYLKTLPPEQLPVKGSQAAQDRKQLLHKQIPIHDIDPTLCHELSNDELKQMNDYISHVKQTSVGVGQIVSLSNIIKANLHMMNPSEAALIASRYPKGIPLAEIVKLHAQSRANPLKQQSLNEKLNKLNLQDSNKALPNYKPSSMNATEENLNPWVTSNVRDVNYPGYTNDGNPSVTNPQFSARLKPNQGKNNVDQNIPPLVPTLDERFMHNPNFDPKNIPSQFLHQNAHYGQPYSYKVGQQTLPFDDNLEQRLGNTTSDQPNSAFAPYSKVPTGYKPGERHAEGSPLRGVNYPSNLPGRGTRSPSGYRPGEAPSRSPVKSIIEDMEPLHPNFAKHLAKYPSGIKKPLDEQSENFGTPGLSSGSGDGKYQTVEAMRKNNMQGLPNYVPGKYNVLSETLSPTKVPQSVKDFAFNTHENAASNPNQEIAFAPPNLAYENYPPGYFNNNQYGMPTGRYPDYKGPVDNTNLPYGQNSAGATEGNDDTPPNLSYENHPLINRASPYKPNIGDSANQYDKNPYGLLPGDANVGNSPNNQYGTPTDKYPYGVPLDDKNTPYDANSMGYVPGQYAGENNNPSTLGRTDKDAYNQNLPYPGTDFPAQGGNVPFDYKNSPYDQTSIGPKSGHPAGPNVNPNFYDQNVPFDPNSMTYPGGNLNPQQNLPYSGKPNKKLSELHPGTINIDEDYLQPSHVTIGAIQDINYPEIKAATQGTNDFYEDYSPENLREILNNVKLPDCHYCKKPFEENEFAIAIDRANVLFHAQCFKCAGCNQILADNVYFYNKETDNVYCGRDYAKVRGFPRCKACDELIFTKEYCLAENSTFHLKHFCCIECDKPLAGQDYTLEDEMPYCLPCFEHSKASKCSSCGRVIKPDEIGCTLNGVHFHAVDECFACKVCKKPLMGKKLLLRNEKLYCSHDCFGTDKK